MKQIAKKLRSRLGETIAETLITLLVASLALMMLAGMISATARIVKTSKDKMDTYYTANEKLQNIGTSHPGSTVIKLDGQDISVQGVYYEENPTFQNKIVTAYRIKAASGD